MTNAEDWVVRLLVYPPGWFSYGSPMTEKSVASPGPRRCAFSRPPNGTGCTRSGRWPWRWTASWRSAGSCLVQCRPRQRPIRDPPALPRVDGELRLEQVKTEASVAVLPIPAPLVSILRGHRARQLAERFTAGAHWRDTGLVFTTASGGLPRTTEYQPRIPQPVRSGRGSATAGARSSPLVRHPAVHDGCAAGNGAANPPA